VNQEFPGVRCNTITACSSISQLFRLGPLVWP